MGSVPREPIYALHIQPVQLDGLYTLVHYHRDCSAVSPKEVLERHSKDRIKRRQLRMVAIARRLRKPTLRVKLSRGVRILGMRRWLGWLVKLVTEVVLAMLKV